MDAIAGSKISFSYGWEQDGAALKEIDFVAEQGEFVAVLGHNGCGKSTLVRHFNALLQLQSGSLRVAGLDLSTGARRHTLRSRCGMVFQSPENQFVSSLVEEDIAFGLRNFGSAEAEIPAKVAAALAQVGLSGYEKRSPDSLSGGQKQRLALAGVLAVDPDILIFDEATAMLDPEGRWALLETIQTLHRKGKTIVMITHSVEEAVTADRVYLMAEGRILQSGTPRAILTDPALLHRAGLLPPMAVQLYYDLAAEGLAPADCPLTKEELVEGLCPLH